MSPWYSRGLVKWHICCDFNTFESLTNRVWFATEHDCLRGNEFSGTLWPIDKIPGNGGWAGRRSSKCLVSRNKLVGRCLNLLCAWVLPLWLNLYWWINVVSPLGSKQNEFFDQQARRRRVINFSLWQSSCVSVFGNMSEGYFQMNAVEMGVNHDDFCVVYERIVLWFIMTYPPRPNQSSTHYAKTYSFLIGERIW